MEWHRTFMKLILTASVAVSMICACGCTTPGQERIRNDRIDWIEFLERGDRAPDDGFWLTRESFMMLYEAAEAAAEMRRNSRPPDEPRSAAEHTPPGGEEPPEGEKPAEGVLAPPEHDRDETMHPAADPAGDGSAKPLPRAAVLNGPIIRF
jgi:hypothetical protein